MSPIQGLAQGLAHSEHRVPVATGFTANITWGRGGGS